MSLFGGTFLRGKMDRIITTATSRWINDIAIAINNRRHDSIDADFRADVKERLIRLVSVVLKDKEDYYSIE